MRNNKEGTLAVKAKGAKSTKTTKATKPAASKTKKVTKEVTAKSTSKTTSKSSSNGFKWGALLTLSLATFVVLVSTTILSLSIGQFVAELKTTISGVQGAAAMYAAVLAAFVLPATKLGNNIGRKKAFAAGAVIFTLGALTASYATNLTVLVLGWSVMQAIGAALMVPQMQSLIANAYSGRARTTAYGVLAAVGASAIAFGPYIGALVIDSMDWQWIFRGLALASALVFVLSYSLKASEEKLVKEKIDTGSVWLNASGKVLIVLGAVLSTKYGFITPRQPVVLEDVSLAPFGLSISITLVALGAILLLIGWSRTKKNEAAKTPALFKASLLKNKQLSHGLAALGLQAVVLVGAIFSIALFLQSTLGLKSVDAGSAMLPLSAAILFASFAGINLGRKFSPKNIVGIGFLMSAAGLLLIDTVIQEGVTKADMIPGLAVIGLGLGLAVSQLQNLVISATDSKDASDVAGLSGSVSFFGNALGTAVIGTILVVGLSFGFANALADEGVYNAQDQELLSSTVQTDFNNLNTAALDELLAQVPEEVSSEIIDARNASNFDSMKTTLGSLAAVSLIGFLVTRRLTAKKLA
jgi:MFS family permease